MTRPRLLVVDGLGGPSPNAYLRSLSPLAELRVLYLPPPFPKEAAQKESVLSTHVDFVTVSRPEQIPAATVEVASSWRPDGLFAQSETVLYDAARAAERLAVSFHSVHTASLLRRKDLQRAALVAAGIPGPRTAVLEPGVDPRAVLAKVGLPAVLKPVMGMGSSSTLLIDSEETLLAACEEASRHYRRDPRMYGSEPVLMLESLLVGQRWHKDERYGDQVSVESLVFDGKVHHLGVTDKYPLAHPFRETGDLMPSTLTAEQQEVLRGAATDAIRALDLRHGAVHTEFKLTADGPRVIEVNGRLGGPVARLLALSAGYDALADVGRMALGMPPQADPRFDRFALFRTPVSPPRDVVVRAVRKVKQARALDGVEDLAIRYPVGTRPDWRMGGRSSLWRAFITSSTADGVFDVAERLEHTLKIELEDVAQPTPFCSGRRFADGGSRVAPARLACEMVGACASGWFAVDKDPDDRIIWRTVEHRAIIQPSEEGIARARRSFGAHRWTFDIRSDEDFDAVLDACAGRRGDVEWLTGRLCDAYRVLNTIGIARCVTVYDRSGALVGGTLFVTIAGAGFVESMFHRASDAGNAAMLGTIELLFSEGCRLIDLQYLASDHFKRFGAIEVPRDRYLELLRTALEPPEPRVVHVPRRSRETAGSTPTT